LHGAPDHIVALQRSRWLDELTDAISQAQRLAWSIGSAGRDGDEGKQLFASLEAVRGKVESLRFGGWVAVREEIDPQWLERLLRDSPFSSENCAE
jgi:hypothetical protein